MDSTPRTGLKGPVFGAILAGFGSLFLWLGAWGLVFRGVAVAPVVYIVVGPLALVGGVLLLAGHRAGQLVGLLGMLGLAAASLAYHVPRHGFSAQTLFSVGCVLYAAYSLARGYPTRPAPRGD